ncbi:unnamed protein product [Dicrocoelium dendriticum]|nr:unnamed protein product [Dicrocoelium dendriticum]
MIKLFDRDYSGCIEFNEFTSLFSYIEQWKTCFQRFDRDNSGAIDASEFKCALQTFRYNLSDSFIQQMVRRFDRTRTGQVAFDDFIHACVCLQVKHVMKPRLSSVLQLESPISRPTGEHLSTLFAPRH